MQYTVLKVNISMNGTTTSNIKSYCMPMRQFCLGVCTPANSSSPFILAIHSQCILILIPLDPSHQYYISSTAHYTALCSRGLMSLFNMEMISNCDGDSPGPPQYFKVLETGGGSRNTLERL